MTPNIIRGQEKPRAVPSLADAVGAVLEDRGMQQARKQLQDMKTPGNGLTLIDCRNRLLTGWRQSIPGGVPDLPPDHVRAFAAKMERTSDLEKYVVVRSSDDLFARGLAVALFVIAVLAVLAVLASVVLTSKGG